jgi:integrase
MVEQRHHDLTVGPNRLGTSGHGRANNALKKLSAIINFAEDRFGTEDAPLIKVNPVTRLSRNRSWHRINVRQTIIPDHKLKDWYRGVCTLPSEVARDLIIFLLFTGLRIGEARKLKWSYVDFEDKILTIPREITKSDREHQLPLSDFLVDLLRKRYLHRQKSEWVFQSKRLKHKHLSESAGILRRVRAKSGVKFTFHDLRRTFLTMADKLEVSFSTLSRLVNHSLKTNTTNGYVICHMEKLRSAMSRITDEFIALLGLNGSDIKEWKPVKESDLTEVTQLRIALDEMHTV